jgi:hypothetical protein
MIYGGQIDAYDFHKSGFTFELLSVALVDAGFADVQRVADFGLFPDTSRVVFAGIPISLNVRARRV